MVRMTPPNTSLYVHVPWCVRKCPYCDFNSHRAPAELPVSRFLAALAVDLDFDLARVPGRSIGTIFIGGGTPSLLEPEAIAAILDAVRSRAHVADGAEVTMEANPGTIEHGRFNGYRQAGVNRISLGAQSFDSGALRTLGRIHDPGDTVRAVDELVEAGFENFNLDLMYGLPEQTVEGALADLGAALDLEPAHVSHYQLTIEPGTVFQRHRPGSLPDDDTAFSMQEACRGLLESRGYGQYEVSAYARPGRRCLHNLNYWNFGDYLGIGPGAHGKWTQPNATVWRTVKPRGPGEYIAGLTDGRDLTVLSRVQDEQLPFEFMMNALRLREGFAVTAFTAATHLPFDRAEPSLRRLCERGLVEESGNCWRATALGFDFLNDLLTEFLPTAMEPAGSGTT
jgi:putative oxygen-independent coproporphyrinogen III oxidase